jgi:hypothetical protein
MNSLYGAFGTWRNLGLEKLRETPYTAGGTLLEAYAWAICSGQLQDRFTNASVFPTFAIWEDSILSRLRNPELEETSNEPYFWHWVQNYTTGRRRVRTESGHVGTVMGEAYLCMNLISMLSSRVLVEDLMH